MNFVGGFLVGFIAALVLETLFKRNKRFKNISLDKPLRYKGYAIHHSSYGIIVLIVSLVLFMINSSYSYFVLGIGVGIIVQHTITDRRLVFIEKK